MLIFTVVSAFILFIALIGCFNASATQSLRLEIRKLSEEVADIHGQLMTFEDILNPSSDAAEYEGFDAEITHELDVNEDMEERVRQLKEEIALKNLIELTQNPTIKHYTQPPAPLHPDVYNIADAQIPDTSYTVEYVK